MSQSGANSIQLTWGWRFALAARKVVLDKVKDRFPTDEIRRFSKPPAVVFRGLYIQLNREVRMASAIKIFNELRELSTNWVRSNPLAHTFPPKMSFQHDCSPFPKSRIWKALFLC
jgi:hypothetical protein